MNNELLIGSMIQEQKCYIEVDVNEELPGYCEDVLVSFDNGLTYPESAAYRENRTCMLAGAGGGNGYFGKGFCTNGSTGCDNGLILSDVTHWLKPLEKRYVLTEEQLYELMRPLDLLVQLKEYKEAFGKDGYYLQVQPQAWEGAIEMIEEYSKRIQSLNPKIK